MEMYERKYYIPKRNIKKSFLERNGFRYNKIFSDSEEEVYSNRYVVWKYGTAGVLEAEISINLTTGEVRIGCFDYGTRNKYASWYCRDCGNNEVVTIIDDKIQKELDFLGVKYRE